MHRRMLLAALLCALLPAAALAQRVARPRSAAPRADLSAPYAKLFPADTFLYLEVNNLAAAAEEVGGVETLYALLARTFGDTGGTLPFTVDELRKALGSSLAVGVRFPRGGLTASNVDPDVVVVVRTSSADVAEIIGKSIAAEQRKESGKRRPTVRTLRGVRITTAAAAKPQDALAYAAVGSTFVFGTPSAVNAVIGGAGAPNARVLADVPGFVSATARANADRQVFAYLNGEPLVKAFNEGVDSTFTSKTAAEREQNRAAAVALKAFLGMDAVLGGSLSATVGNGGVGVQGALELDRTRGGLVSVLSDAPAIAMRSANVVPADTDLVVASSVDTIAIYDLVLRVLTPQVTKAMNMPSPPAMIEMAEAQIGMKLRDDLLAAFGNEVAVALRVTPPKPAAEDAPAASESYDGVFLFEVRRPETLDAAFTKLAAKEGGEDGLKRETYKDVSLIRLDSMSYGYLEGFGLLGDDAEVRRAIDAVRDGATLATTADYAASVGSVPDNVLTGAYFSPQFFEYSANELGKWTGVPREVEPVRSGLFFAVQKDANGIFGTVQVPLPNLRLLLEEKKKRADTARR